MTSAMRGSAEAGAAKASAASTAKRDRRMETPPKAAALYAIAVVAGSAGRRNSVSQRVLSIVIGRSFTERDAEAVIMGGEVRLVLLAIGQADDLRQGIPGTAAHRPIVAGGARVRRSVGGNAIQGIGAAALHP